MQRKKKIFSLRALVFAVLVTATVSSVTLSRYMTTVTGTATASIANFKVELNYNTDAEKIDMSFDGSSYNGLSESKAYGFKIISESDVALTYRVEVDFGEVAPPAQVSLWIDSGTVQKGDGTTTKFTFDNFTYPLNTEYIEHTLYIQVEYATDNDNVHNISKLAWDAVAITVTAEQS